jgi:hypothetical protein
MQKKGKGHPNGRLPALPKPRNDRLPFDVIIAATKYNLEAHRTVLACWVKGKSNLIQITEKGNTLAHVAALNGHVTLFAYLVGKGVSPHTVNNEGNNVLDALLSHYSEFRAIENKRQKYLTCIEKCFEYELDFDEPAAWASVIVSNDLNLAKLLVKMWVSVNQLGIENYPLLLSKISGQKLSAELISFFEDQSGAESLFSLSISPIYHYLRQFSGSRQFIFFREHL